jgi:adenylate cyclase
LAVLEILEFEKNTKENPPKGIYLFDVRIGISTGPVVAGVVGTMKFQYHIWGNTLNKVAHMESNSEPEKINIAENTHQYLKEIHHFNYRGRLEVNH